MRGFKLGRLFGIKIAVDWSLLFIFVLITTNLGAGLFPSWHPDWSAGLRWSVALVSALLFFASVLAHEISHALVGRAFGLEVRSITLFIFGGMANIEREPPSPKAEFLMAFVGPLTSLAIGVGCALLGGALADVPRDLVARDPEAAMRGVGPAATLLLWLGPINVLLGLFNLVPGFPLDGGRLLRAAVWRFTGDLRKATRIATAAGQSFGWLLVVTGGAMIFGIRVPVFGAGLIGGLWLAFIGWFLASAAAASYQQFVVSEVLEDVPVRQVMRRDFAAVPAGITVGELVDEHLMGTDQRAFGVVEAGRLVGMVCFEDVRRAPRDAWQRMRVADIMTPAAELVTVGPSDEASRALRELARKDVDQLPVIDHGQVIGVVRRGDILKWLELQAAAPATGSRDARPAS